MDKCVLNDDNSIQKSRCAYNNLEIFTKYHQNEKSVTLGQINTSTLTFIGFLFNYDRIIMICFRDTDKPEKSHCKIISRGYERLRFNIEINARCPYETPNGKRNDLPIIYHSDLSSCTRYVMSELGILKLAVSNSTNAKMPLPNYIYQTALQLEST